MREIKFRAWDSENSEWIYAEPVYGFFPSLPFEWKPERYGDMQQFTGLKDKKGKEIYEGDIVRDAYAFTYEIVWKSHYWAFKHSSGSFFPSKKNLHCEVIGNIYENPDLLS